MGIRANMHGHVGLTQHTEASFARIPAHVREYDRRYVNEETEVAQV